MPPDVEPAPSMLTQRTVLVDFLRPSFPYYFALDTKPAITAHTEKKIENDAPRKSISTKIPNMTSPDSFASFLI